jgi:cyclase
MRRCKICIIPNTRPDQFFDNENTVSVPVIASGGAGNYDHMVYAIRDGGTSAVAAASMFHFTDQTPLEAKKKLNESGIPVRDCYRM